jgi:hypothetical protein
MKTDKENAVAVREELSLDTPRRGMTSLDILEAAVRGGITGDNVAVVKEIIAMRREEEAEQAKRAFVQAFFALRKSLPIIYADKEVKTKSGEVAFEYCSPSEIKDIIEPHVTGHGFCTMTGQEMGEGRVTVTVTLMHEKGHSESRSFTCRVSPGNSLMSPTQCDAAASTSAERHALIKLFGLRTRINPSNDPRNEGTLITPEQAEELQHRVKMTNGNEAAFLKLAGVGAISGTITLDHYKSIMSSKLSMLDEMLQKKEQKGR